MTQFFRSAWSVLILLFVALLLVQFFLAGIGAFQVPKGSYDDQWVAHRGLGDLLLLLTLLLLLVALAARLSRRLSAFTGLLFALMIVQFVLGQLSGTTVSALGALHPVNALLILGVAGILTHQARAYLPFERFRPPDGAAPGRSASGAES
jgi:hypothetical protein